MKGLSKYFAGALVALIVTGALDARGQEWTRFRGPNGQGISHAKSIPTKWSEADFNWKAPLPGTGHSSPVLWGDNIFLTSTDESTGGVMVLCVNAADGKVRWRKDMSFPPYQHHKFNSFAASSPAVDNERVYICWTTPERHSLIALTHSGGMVWERDFGPFLSQHGGGISPVVYEGKVILGNEQDGESFIVAVDAASGKDVWKTPRTATRAAYSTPCIYEPKHGGPWLIFNSQSHGIYAVDPQTGKVQWEYAQAFDKRSVSSPVLAGDLIIGSCGAGGGGNYVVAVRVPQSPCAKPSLAYEIRRSAPYVPTGIAMDGLLFLWGDGGIVTCVDAPTGKTKWQERVGGNFFGSPVWVDGRLFCISTSGEVVVIEASDKFQVLARNGLGELSHGTPAIAGGRMYLRTEHHLVSVGGETSRTGAAD